MKLGRGKSKGNRFENLVGRTLSKWLKPGDATQLIPTRLSGGWRADSWRQAGDLAPNGPAGEKFRNRIMIECKHHKKDLLWMLFTAIRGAANRNPDRLLYKAIFRQAPHRQETVTLKAACGPGDHGEPVLTVMLPDED